MATEDMLFTVPAGVGPVEDGGGTGGLASIFDEEFDRVFHWFSGQVDLEKRFSEIFRQSIDEVLDGQRTGRYDVDCLEKTEKTYLGTKVEIICRAEFGFTNGVKMDYCVSGVDVDAKFSLTSQWMIPREAVGHICLVMSANDKKSNFSVGLIRIREEVLTKGGNQDSKRSISKEGRAAIKWLCQNEKLKRNLLLGLEPEVRDRVMAVPAGQRRVDELFKQVQGCVVDRNAVLTTGKQLDAPKRVRDARSRLAPQGIIILGHQNESPRIARSLGLPVPEKGTWVSVRVVPAPSGTSRRRVEINGVCYVVAEQGDPPSPAPAIRY